jgi:hypothetical protein
MIRLGVPEHQQRGHHFRNHELGNDAREVGVPLRRGYPPTRWWAEAVEHRIANWPRLERTGTDHDVAALHMARVLQKRTAW